MLNNKFKDKGYKKSCIEEAFKKYLVEYKEKTQTEGGEGGEDARVSSQDSISNMIRIKRSS